MSHKSEKYIQDAITACRELRDFTAGKTLTDLESDRGLQLIVEREFEILGEALNRLRRYDEPVFEKISNGHRIVGTRNLLAHGYDIVEHVILWDALQKDLPKLEEELMGLLEGKP